MRDHAESTKILIADNDPKIRLILRQGLEDEVFTIVEAEDGLSAIETFRKENPDLVLMDVKIPGMNGLEVMAQIKEQFSDIPVVILSAYPDAKIIVQAMRDGAVDFLIKPFGIDVVRWVIQKALDRKELNLDAELYEERDSSGTHRPQSVSLKKIVQAAIAKAEKKAILWALEETKWNKKKAAALHEISYRSLLYKIKEYAI